MAEQISDADRKIPFPASEASEAFTRGLAEMAQAIVDQNRARFVSPENVLCFRHGEGWNIRRADASEDVGSFRKIEVLKLIGKDRIVSNDLDALLAFVRETAKELSEHDERLMIETVSQAAEQSGNEVSASETGSPARSYLEALKSLAFSADKEGNVSLPQLVLSPEGEKMLRADLEGQGPAYDLEVKAVQLEKAAEAVREELKRLSRYEGFDERR
jgi:hypothetical protein